MLFVDADDHIEPEYTDYFLQLVFTLQGCDIAVDTHHFSIRKKVQVLHDNIRVETAEQVIEKIYTGAVNVAVWNKIYRRSFLEREHIRFRNDIWFGEGMLFNIECLQKVDRVVVGERRVYHQTYNPDSAMRHFRMDSQYCGIRSMEIQKSIWEKSTPSIEAAYSWHLRNYNWSILHGLIGNNLINQYPEDYASSIENLRKDILVPLKADIGIIRKIRSLIVSAAPVLSAKIYVFLRKTYVALHKKKTE